jgi:pimeloyl-ACP methyl ester carboxylesterase
VHADQARTAVALLDALGIARAYWVGNSQGGQSAMVAAITYPERVGKFVMGGSHIGTGGDRYLLANRASEGSRATRQLNGKSIGKGEKVAMWYIAGNRDPEEIEDPDRFIIDRARPRQHLSFGFGIHRCVGNRLAEMQLTILWEEILKRFPPIEVVEKPKRAYSNLIHGITEMKVRIPA